MNLIHDEVREQTRRLGDAYRDARFFPHVVIDRFFTEETARDLLAAFPGYEAEHAMNELGLVGPKAVREQVRSLGPAFEALDDCVRSPDFLSLISEITGIPDLRYDPEYVGGGTHDNLDGTELDIHVDFNYHPTTGWHRRLNLIVFLNAEWEASWGGNFELHRDPWSDQDEVESVTPFFNRAVIFETSERSWHGFDTIALPDDKKHLSRKSFALYFYTKERPEAEIAAEHATVYVPRRLPTHLEAGHTLTEDDVETLGVQIARRDQQIQFLYEREKEFSDALHQLRGRVKELQGLLTNVPLAGPARAGARTEGLWEDLWAGDEVTIPLRAEAPLTRITVQGWVPDHFPTGRTVVVSVGDAQAEAEIAHGLFEVACPIEADAGDDVTVRITCPDTFDLRRHDPTTGDDRQLGYVLKEVAVA